MCWSLEFKGKYIIKSKLVCETGLHIGGASEGLEIGGLDNPVIKDTLTDEPYIPGSGLKGKLRSLLEWSLGPNVFTGMPHHFTQNQKSRGEPTFSPCSCGRCASCILFGVTPQSSVNEKKAPEQECQEKMFAAELTTGDQGKTFLIAGPTRLTVRDGFLTDEPPRGDKSYKTKTEIQDMLGKNFFTEVKTENTLDRVTAEANPRPMERVPRGAAFDIEMVFDVYRPKDKDLLKDLFTAMHLLEESALGGTVSRGSGKVSFTDITATFRPVSYYKTGDESPKNTVDNIPQKVADIIMGFENIQWKFPAS